MIQWAVDFNSVNVFLVMKAKGSRGTDTYSKDSLPLNLLDESGTDCDTDG